jgi:hypothetical protein
VPNPKVPQRRLLGYSRFHNDVRLLFGGRTRTRTWDPMIKRKRAPFSFNAHCYHQPDDLSASVRNVQNFCQCRFVTENVVRTVVRPISIFAIFSEVADFTGSGRGTRTPDPRIMIPAL